MAGYQRQGTSHGGIDVQTGLSFTAAKRAREEGGIGGGGSIGMDGLQKPNIYYNGNIVNNNPPGVNVQKYDCVASFQDSRSAEIIRQNAQNYNLSLMRCSLNTKDIPLFIPKVMPNYYDSADFDMLDYRVGVQLTASGTLSHLTAGVGSGEVPLALSSSSEPFNIGTAPNMTVYPVDAIPTTNNWTYSGTNLAAGGVWYASSSVGANGWLSQLSIAAGGYIDFTIVRFPAGGMGTVQFGSPAYLVMTLAGTPLAANKTVVIDFTTDGGSQNPAPLCNAIGIPVGTIVTLGPGKTNYVCPLGIRQGPGVYTYTIESFSFLKWIAEDDSVNYPTVPPPPPNWDIATSYANGRQVTYPTSSDGIYIARPGVNGVILSGGAPPDSNPLWISQGSPDWTLYRDDPYYYSYNYDNFLRNVVNKAIDNSFRDSPLNTYGTDPTYFQSFSAETQFLKFQEAQTTCTTSWVKNTAYAMGASVTYASSTTLGNTVYIANYDLTTTADPPGTDIGWLKVGESTQSSWCSTRTYYLGQLVTYGLGTYYICTTSPTLSTVPPPLDPTNWTTPMSGYPGTFPTFVRSRKLCSATPYFTYKGSSNLFDLVMDTYSIYGAEDSQGLSGSVRSYFNQDVIYPGFESLRLVSDFNFSGLFANFEQQIRENDNVPILYGGITTPIDSTLTLPPTAAPSATAAALLANDLFNQYPSRFQRLGIWVPGNGGTVTSPIWSSVDQSFFYAIRQQFESTSTLWCPVDAIVVTSGTIPLQKELLANPTYVPSNSPASTGSQQSGQNTAQILTDFSLDARSAQAYRSFIQYIPVGEYRRMSLRDGGAFQIISFTLFWRNRYTQNLIPVTLSAGGSCNLKFLFEPL